MTKSVKAMEPASLQPHTRPGDRALELHSSPPSRDGGKGQKPKSANENVP